MNRALIQYQQTSNSIKELGNLYNLIITNFPLLTLQADEILRAQYVLIISALDCYIHDSTRYGLIEIYKGTRVSCSNTKKYPIKFDTLQQIEATSDINIKLAHLESQIIETNSKDSYQSPKGIEYALSLVNVKSVWSKISTDMSMTPDDIKQELSLIINRRNKIAHESDINPATGSKYPINNIMVDKVIAFIDKMVDSIHKLF